MVSVVEGTVSSSAVPVGFPARMPRKGGHRQKRKRTPVAVGFGMWEGAEGTVPSALFIDNVRLPAVPEASTLVLVGVGLTGILLRHRAWIKHDGEVPVSCY